MKTQKKKTEKEVKNQPQKKKLTAKQRRSVEAFLFLQEELSKLYQEGKIDVYDPVR